MIRIALYLLLAVIVISVVRSIAGILAKALSGVIESSPSAQNRPSVPSAGELKQDPVCGTYVSTATTFRKNARGQTYYFCSAGCLSKFKS